MILFSLVGRVARTRSSCLLRFHSSPAAAAITSFSSATTTSSSSSSATASFCPVAALVGRRARNLGQLSPYSPASVHCQAMSTAAAEPQRRVLSIQSHVVHGYVGNKSATFPLQVLGFEVDAINSVQFSNHTGYAHIKGQVLDDSQLNDLVTGLELNGLLDRYSHLLTGYVGKDAFLRKVVDTVRKLRAQNPHLVYVCDPVMGDDGHMYVPANLLPIYRDEIIPLADICTPNQFEAELLTGEKIHSEADAWRAMQWFHERGVRTVALSSTDLGSASELRSFVSHLPAGKSLASAAQPLRLAINIPTQGAGVRFTGTGDLFASLFLAHSTLQADDVKSAFERTVATLQSVIANTVARIPPNLAKVESDHRELKIVQSKCDIETPRVVLQAVEVV